MFAFIIAQAAANPSPIADFPFWVVMVMVTPIVLPGLGISTALLIAGRPRIQAHGEWWTCLLSSLMLPFAIFLGVVYAGWLETSQMGGLSWMVVMIIIQTAYVLLWYRRWRPEERLRRQLTLDEP
jgi:hypothetical protein